MEFLNKGERYMQNKSCSSLWEKGLRASTWNVVGVVSHICNHESDYPFVRDTEIGYYAEIAG